MTRRPGLPVRSLPADASCWRVLGWAGVERAYKGARIAGQLRESGEFARLAFAGLDLVPPGVVLVSEWRPDDDGPRPSPAEVSCYGGVARKP